MVRRPILGFVVAVVVAACGTSSASPTGGPSVTPTPSMAVPSVAPSVVASVVASPTSDAAKLKIVAVGDSIPFNSGSDCPGCTSFVDRYAKAITDATGRPIEVRNLSEHNGLQVAGLLAELSHDQVRKEALAAADVIIVGIAHNDTPMNRDDDPCDGAGGDDPDWSKYDAACVAAAVATYTPKYKSVYEQIAALRAGKPTILRTIDRYNDWNGWPAHDLSPEGIAATKLVIDAWNDMICSAAEASGFLCGDIYSRFNGPDGLTPSGDLLAADYTHPSDKGNEVIADTLIELGFTPLVP
jgi:lysophospholipase L1-like esterase